MKKRFSAELASLRAILQWVSQHFEETSLSDVEIRRIEIALEEGIVNIISYAYQGKVGDIEVSFEHHIGEYIEITFKDTGLPFNPLKHKKEVDPFTPVEEIEEGGLGILFMQKLMDKIEYTRKNDTNTLTLRKNLAQKSP